MSHPNSDRDERVTVQQVRELLAKRKTEMRPLPSTELYIAHVGYLLSLLDSQVDETCLHCEKPIRRIGSAWLHVESKLVSCRRGKSQEHNGIYRAEPATKESIATRMRDRCVQKVRELRDGWQADADARRDPDNPHDYKGSYGLASGAVDACDDIITALQSLTLEGEQEKSK